jgi:hypothetical protein
MAAAQRRSTHRAGRALLVGSIAMAHVAAFLVASLSLLKDTPPRAEPRPQTYAMLPFAPPAPPAGLSTRSRPRNQRAKRQEKKKTALAAAPAARTAPPAAPSWTLSAPRAQRPAARELADPYAVREALRGSVGCDLENLKLRPDERARCADRTARWAQRGRKIGPAEDDPIQTAELALEEDYVRRMHEWKTTDCGTHNAQDELDERGTLGPGPPQKGKPPSDYDRNAC